METSSGCITLLQPELIKTLRSMFIISDHVQAVEEIVANSIDALATRIEIRLCFRPFELMVLDNGKPNAWVT